MPNALLVFKPGSSGSGKVLMTMQIRDRFSLKNSAKNWRF
jgi:hypothetical protein